MKLITTGVVDTYRGFDITLDDQGRFTSIGTKSTYDSFHGKSSYEISYSLEGVHALIDAELDRREQEKARKQRQATGDKPRAVLWRDRGDITGVRVTIRGHKKGAKGRYLVTFPDGSKGVTGEGGLSSCLVLGDLTDDELVTANSLREVLNARDTAHTQAAGAIVRSWNHRPDADTKATFVEGVFVAEGLSAPSLSGLRDLLTDRNYLAAAPWAVGAVGDGTYKFVDGPLKGHGYRFATREDAVDYIGTGRAAREARAAWDAFVSTHPMDEVSE